MTEEPPGTAAPARIARTKLTWLEAQSGEWVAAGLLDPSARTRILARYEAESSEHRSMLALMILGALMLAIGVLLLIGYNWSAFPAAGKVAILMGSVALAFAASAVALSRRHQLAGEIVALVGVLLYGNAIWLIAQALHIQGHFPDGFLSWAAGAVIAAALLGSRILGVAGAALAMVWIVAAAIASRRPGDMPVVPFLLLWPAALAFGYRLQSATMVKILALGAAVWIAFWPAGVNAEEVALGTAAIAACWFYSLGWWHRAGSAMGRSWQSAGCGILLATFVPLLVADFHDDETANVTWRAVVPALVLVASVLASSALRRAHARYLADYALAGTAAAIAAWLVLLARRTGGGEPWGTAMTVAFSVLSLALAVSLMRKALRTDRVSDLTFGVAFALVFLLVRWASLIDSMLWSGIMLVAASAGFFAIARLWRHRRRSRRDDIAIGGAS